MELTVSEANAFWPVYEEYQAELGKRRHREVKLIEEFSANFGTMPDDVAKSLLDDSLSINLGYLALRQSYLAEFRDVLPGTEVARHCQLENKIEAGLRYEQAKRIPLVQQKGHLSSVVNMEKVRFASAENRLITTTPSQTLSAFRSEDRQRTLSFFCLTLRVGFYAGSGYQGGSA